MDALHIVWKVLTIIGSFGLFLYGMKFMSESLQRAAGQRMRNVLAVISSNPARGIASGFTLTSMIQFSSATVILTISLVNAGLLGLYESVGIIMGANIGTTVKAWFISMLGFQYNFNLVLLPMVALALPFLFSGRHLYRYWGEFVLGFALIFLGFNFMKENLPVLQPDSAALEYLSHLAGYGFFSVLTFVVAGFLLALLLQSSSAGMAVVFVMVSNNWITYEMAAAMIIGENVGTTLVPIIASLVANRLAQRAAVIHLLFNLTGLILALVFFRPFVSSADWFSIQLLDISPYDSVNAIPISLAFLHSAFNILTTIVLLGLIPWLVRGSELLVPESRKPRNPRQSPFLDDTILSTPELYLLQSRQVIAVFAEELLKMFEHIPVLLNKKDQDVFEDLYIEIDKQEKRIDQVESDINASLTKLSEGEISRLGSRQISAMLKIIDELESIGDTCLHMARTIKNKNAELAWFPPEIREELYSMFSLNRVILETMIQNLRSDYEKVDITRAQSLEIQLNKRRDDLKIAFEKQFDEALYPQKTAYYFREMLALTEKLGDYAINVSEAIYRTRERNP